MSSGFQVLVLGCTGGPQEHNLSSYLVYPVDEPKQAIVLDGGSPLYGLRCAAEKKNLSDFISQSPEIVNEREVLNHYIQAFLFSHAHLDHICGFVINSQIDTPGKALIGTHQTIDVLRDCVFNGKVWPNYGNEGEGPIGIYSYYRLNYEEIASIPNTLFKVEAFSLCHPEKDSSTAFLLEYKNQFLLYVGDTSADTQSSTSSLLKVWEKVAPIVREKRLKGIFLECSVPQEDMKQVCYGHLCPSLFLEELSILKDKVGEKWSSPPIFVTHRKESYLHNHDMKRLVQRDLLEMAPKDFNLIFPKQGNKYSLD